MILLYLLTVIYFILNFDIGLCVVQISTSPLSVTANVNDTTTFDCKVKDSTAINISKVNWYFVEHNLHISQGLQIKVVPGKRYKIIKPQIHDDSGNSFIVSLILQITNITTTDQGHYKCMVNGTDASVIHRLTVNGAPVSPPMNNLSQSFNFTDCCIKEKMSESCLPACSPYLGPNSVGLFDAVAACSNDLEKLLKCGTDGKNHAGCCKRRGVSDLCYDFCLGEIPNTLNDNHTICITQFVDIYACLEEGRVTLPGPPGSVTARSVDSNTILVTWKAPIQNANLVTGYIVSYKLMDESAYMSIATTGTGTEMLLKSLKTDYKYDIYVVAKSSHGSSQRSETVRMAPAKGPVPTEHFDYISECCIKKKINSDCQKAWCNTKPISPINPQNVTNCMADFESILQCVTGERNHTGCCNRNNVPVHCFALCGPTRLLPALTFDMYSCIQNIDVIERCILEGLTTIPGVPLGVHLTEVTSTTAIVEWESNGFGANATGYRVGLRHPNDLTFSLTTVTELRIVYNNLKPDHFYEVEVRAFSDEGISNPSPQITFLTYGSKVTVRPPTTPAPSLYHDFLGCCVNASVTEFCQQLCNYTAYPEVGLTIDPVYIDNCGADILNIVACGADGRDHRPCCVNEGFKEKKCIDLCYHTPTAEIDTDVECIKYTAEYAKCFREGIVTHPRHPENVFVSNQTAHTITLSWSQPTRGPQVVEYVVVYSVDGGDTWQEQTTTNTLFIIQGLTPSTLYKLAVISVGQNGTTSAPSPFLELYTKTYGKCQFIANSNSVAKASIGNNLLNINTTKVKSKAECEKICDDFPPEANLCMGYNYETVNGQPICTLIPPVYNGSKVTITVQNKTGSLYLKRNCKKIEPPPLFNGTVPPSWDAYWQTKEECCNNSGMTASCKTHCLSGNFGDNPGLCGQDFHKALACASDGKDHSDCCKAGFIPDQCLAYCKGQALPPGPVSALCLSYSNTYISCFRTGAGRLPSPPTSFRVLQVASKYVLVGWNRPDDNCNGEQNKKCTYDISYWSSTLASPPENRNTKTVGPSLNQFNITGLQPEKSYIVIAVARNTYGSSLPAPKLVVITRKEVYLDIAIDQYPEGIVDKGSRVKLTCNVFGDPVPMVSWMFNNNEVNKGRQFTISRVDKNSEGIYTCVADQSLGSSPDTKQTYLNIRYEPDIVKITGDAKYPKQGLKAILRCEFKGHPDKIIWKKVDSPDMKIPDYRHRPTNIYTDYDKGISVSELYVYNVVDGDYGTYTCSGSNSFGKHIGTVTLTNEYKAPSALPTIPPKSKNETVRQCCARGGISGVCLDLCHIDVDMHLVVNQSEKYGKCLDHMETFIGCAADGKDHSQCCKKAGITQFCMPFCKGLVPDITSDNIVDCIFASEKMIDCAEEGHDNIPSKPESVISKLKDDEIEISWNPPQHNSDKVDFYEIHYSYTGSIGSTEHSVEKKRLYYAITDVQIKVKYTIWIVAANDFGKSQPSYARVLYIENIKPSAPTDLYAEVVDGTSIQLRWTEPKTTATIKEYIIYYNQIGSSEIKKISSNTNSILITGLNPLTQYNIYVVARNDVMSSSQSNRVSVSTTKGGQTSAQSGANEVGLGVGLTVMFLVIIAVGIALFIFWRRKRGSKFAEAVSFENPQYGDGNNSVQISGLPADNTYISQGQQFDYSPLHEESDTDHHFHDKAALADNGIATLHVDQIDFHTKDS